MAKEEAVQWLLPQTLTSFLPRLLLETQTETLLVPLSLQGSRRSWTCQHSKARSWHTYCQGKKQCGRLF